MVNKEDLLNELYRLHRYKQSNTLNFLPKFETISLDSVVKVIEEIDAEEDIKEISMEEKFYNIIHTMADIHRGISRAVGELEDEELLFIIKIFESMKENKNE